MFAAAAHMQHRLNHTEASKVDCLVPTDPEGRRWHQCTEDAESIYDESVAIGGGGNPKCYISKLTQYIVSLAIEVREICVYNFVVTVTASSKVVLRIGLRIVSICNRNQNARVA